MSQQPTEAKNWFNDEAIVDQLKNMTTDEMNSLLLELSGTRMWVAVLKYVQARTINAQRGLFTLDPFKDQTNMARYQGILNGIMELPEIVGLLVNKQSKIEE